MNYSKIRFHDKPLIKQIDSKEYHIRKAQDDSIYQVITYSIENNFKTLFSIEYISKEKYQKFNNDEIINYEEEYEKLKKVLEKYDIIKCDECKEYSNDCDQRDLCDIWSCGCVKITRVKSCYLSGSFLCEKCILNHCHFCLGLTESGKNLCSDCEINLKK